MEFRGRLLEKKNAVGLLAERGVFLSKAHVITEDDYNKGHTCDDPDEIVLVLPNQNRADLSRKPLLETAKLLMAITPNRIWRGCDSVSGPCLKRVWSAYQISSSKTIAREHSEVGGFEWHG